MEKFQNLKMLIKSLQDKIRKNSLDSESVKKATEILATIGYEYDENLFPELPADIEFSSYVGPEPNNLAEALLWKMGKWNIYKDFVKSFSSDAPLTKKTDVVFAAFAKHLRDASNPIYDQHTLRAMWAINVNLDLNELHQCKAALIKSKGKDKGKWKATLSGSETITCYNLYVIQVNCLAKNGLTRNMLDKLLMPLGQALKGNSINYDEFVKLRGDSEIG